MEHSLSPLSVGRPWRTTALVASGVAVLELVVLVVLAAAVLGRPVAERVQEAAHAAAVAKPAPKPEPAPVRSEEERSQPTLARPETSVLVLNGNGRPGAASEAGDLVHARGYVVTAAANAQRSDYPRTLIMYRPGRKTEALRLARDLGVHAVGPLDGLTVRELMGAQLVLILGER